MRWQPYAGWPTGIGNRHIRRCPAHSRHNTKVLDSWTFLISDRPRSFAVISASPNYRGRYRNAATGYVVGNVLESCAPHDDRSHALRGNAARDAPRPSQAKRGASVEAFPRGAWERSNREQGKLAQGSDWIEQFVIRRAIAAANHSIAPSGHRQAACRARVYCRV